MAFAFVRLGLRSPSPSKSSLQSLASGLMTAVISQSRYSAASSIAVVAYVSARLHAYKKLPFLRCGIVFSD